MLFNHKSAPPIVPYVLHRSCGPLFNGTISKPRGLCLACFSIQGSLQESRIPFLFHSKPPVCDRPGSGSNTPHRSRDSRSLSLGSPARVQAERPHPYLHLDNTQLQLAPMAPQGVGPLRPPAWPSFLPNCLSFWPSPKCPRAIPLGMLCSTLDGVGGGALGCGGGVTYHRRSTHRLVKGALFGVGGALGCSGGVTYHRRSTHRLVKGALFV